MTASATIATFARDLQQDCLARAEVDGDEALLAEVLTRVFGETLQEAGELSEAWECHLKRRGIEVSGYGIEEDGSTLNLLGTIRRGIPPETVPKSVIDKHLARMLGLWTRCRERPLHPELEESTDAFDMALHIYQAASEVRRVRLYLLTDGLTNVAHIPPSELEGVEILTHVWDLERLHRYRSAGLAREPITIDFNEHGGPIPALTLHGEDADYGALLCAMPGQTLAEIYDRHGARLLELNVRSFLQARGKINRGIRDTLRDDPERFLAYNNGISATASEVRLVELPNGGHGLVGIRDLQIVNGGQTTASLHRALLGKVDLSRVLVQTKISVAAPELLDELVPLISRYANSQNRVQEADLSANHSFHVKLEELSRTTWAPAKKGSQVETRWFYERARGSYADQLAHERTPARQRAFTERNPRNQRFDKTDVAKYEHCYSQLPHVVSRGAQKNFVQFMTSLAAESLPDDQWFRHLVAKAILFRRTDRIVAMQNFGGYKLNIVAYTIALMSNRVQRRIDLDAIWNSQALSPAVEDGLEDLCHLVQHVIAYPPGGRNVTEWAKRDECWQAVLALEWEISDRLRRELSDRDPTTRPVVNGASVNGRTEINETELARVTALGPDGWTALVDWAKQTRSLQPWERSIAANLPRYLRAGVALTRRQVGHGTSILSQALAGGFDPDAVLSRIDAVAETTAFGADGWASLVEWAKATKSLQPWERGVAAGIAERLRAGERPSVKQAAHGIRMMEEAAHLGFSAPTSRPAERESG